MPDQSPNPIIDDVSEYTNERMLAINQMTTSEPPPMVPPPVPPVAVDQMEEQINEDPINLRTGVNPPEDLEEEPPADFGEDEASCLGEDFQDGNDEHEDTEIDFIQQVDTDRQVENE